MVRSVTGRLPSTFILYENVQISTPSSETTLRSNISLQIFEILYSSKDRTIVDTEKEGNRASRKVSTLGRDTKKRIEASHGL